jgi:double-strand break repair protein MRE11
VEELIWKATENWKARQVDDGEKSEMMLPLIRLKVSLWPVTWQPGLMYCRWKHPKRRKWPIRWDSDRTSSVESQIPEISCNTTDGKRLLKGASPVSLGSLRLTSALESKNLPDAPDGEEDDDWVEDDDNPAAITAADRLAKLRMANLVKQYLQAQNLEVLIEGGLEDAVMRFVDKDDKDAIKE